MFAVFPRLVVCQNSFTGFVANSANNKYIRLLIQQMSLF